MFSIHLPRHNIPRHSLRYHSRKVFGALILACLVLLVPAVAQAQDDWWNEAAEQTRDDIEAVETTVSQTLDELAAARERLEQFEQFVDANITDPRERRRIQATVAEAREALDTYSEPLELFDGHLGTVTETIDKVAEVQAMAERIGETRGGSAGQALRAIAIAMESYGEDVPIIGDMLVAYGEATNAILDATNRIAETIDTQRNQGMFGLGTYGGVDNPLYQAMSEQFGEEVADGYTFAPTDTPNIYTTVDPPGAFTMIWNPDTQKWVKADRPPAAVARLYRSYLLAHGRPTPEGLAALATVGYEGAINRLSAGQELVGLWDEWLTSSGTFYLLDQRHDYALSGLLGDPATFAARFAHDADFNRQVRAWVSELYAEALKEHGSLGPDEDLLATLRAWADQYGIPLSEAPGEEEDEQGAAEEDDPQDEQDDSGDDPDDDAGEEDDTGAGTTRTHGPSGNAGGSTGSGESVLLLFDASGSMGDNGKIDAAKSAARNVLAQVQQPTEVALIVFYGCGNIQVEHPFTTDYVAVQETINDIYPSNDTPLAAAISFAKQYIQDHASGGNARLVILSDGQETCGGNPVSAAAN